MATLAVCAASAVGTLAMRQAPVPLADVAYAGDSATRATPPVLTAPASSAADPFVMGGTGADRVRALQCLTSAIYYEAANEPDRGQSAIAQVVLNRVRHPAFPGTVCGVVYQGAAAATGCQFSFACDGAVARVPQRAAWERARRVAARALAGYVFAPVGLATHYHSFAVDPRWARTLVMTDTEGAHFFHRWKGAQGTRAAFTRVYRGGEPVPAPLRIDPPPPIAPAMPLAHRVRGDQPCPQPFALNDVEGHVSTRCFDIAQRERVLDADRTRLLDAALPERSPDSPILDRWKDTGTPLH